MKALRIRIRTLMLIVVLAALGMWIWGLQRLARHYLSLAKLHAAKEKQSLANSQQWLFVYMLIRDAVAREKAEQRAHPNRPRRMDVDHMDPSLNRLVAEGWEGRAAFHRRLREKYERAAHRPWLPVSADPPEPPDPVATVEATIKER